MTTDNRPPVRDYSLLFPLLIGVISLLGIGLMFGLVWFPKQSNQVVPTRTLTPFKYLLLATLTPVPIAEVEAVTFTEILSTPTETSDGDAVLLNPPLTEQIEISTNETFFTSTVTTTPNPIFAESKPMTVGTYDDVDSHIIRNGNWKNQDNLDAYQQTLLVSNTAGNYIAFSFIGQQMVLGYQTSGNAGDVTVNIDGAESTITQLVGNAWFSQELEPGTHYVILTHTSGASVSLDYIDIPG